eukprot:726072-Amphidinium_carterae.2
MRDFRCLAKPTKFSNGLRRLYQGFNNFGRRDAGRKAFQNLRLEQQITSKEIVHALVSQTFR